MKKILLGLVVALMMTGSGYAQSIEQSKCDYLLRTADFWVMVMESPAAKSDLKLLAGALKDAHLYAGTWSALCKD